MNDYNKSKAKNLEKLEKKVLMVGMFPLILGLLVYLLEKRGIINDLFLKKRIFHLFFLFTLLPFVIVRHRRILFGYNLVHGEWMKMTKSEQKQSLLGNSVFIFMIISSIIYGLIKYR